MINTAASRAYTDLLASKSPRAERGGLDSVPPLATHLRAYQADCVEFGLRLARWGLFLDTGLGKTACELEWCLRAGEASNGKSLILCPLAVAQQIAREGERWGYPVQVIRNRSEVRDGISIANYDRLHLLDIDAFGAVALDESSILKSFAGKISRALRSTVAGHRWRMCASATPAPNDHHELGQSAEFLGVMSAAEMQSQFFIVDHASSSARLRLKGHAAREFWDWVASWSRMAGHPEDLGHPEEGFELPQLRVIRHDVRDVDPGSGLLGGFLSVVAPEVGAMQIHDVKRRTAGGRAEVVAEAVAAEPEESWIVWCDTDYEADALKAELREVAAERLVEVRGSMSVEAKEAGLERFTMEAGTVLVTKPSIAGWGLNWQHCARVAFAGRSYSYESWYQAVRRCWRYGQKREVIVHLAVAEGEATIGRTLERKEREHVEMRVAMAEAMRRDSARSAVISVPYDPQCVASAPSWLGGGEVLCFDERHGRRFSLFSGDCVPVLAQLPDASIDLSIFSPPFAALFIYSDQAADMGNCGDDEEFLTQYRFLAEELHRVTRPGRMAVVHCKHLMNLKSLTGKSSLRDFPGKLIAVHESAGWDLHAPPIVIWRDPVRQQATSKGTGLNYKDLRADSTRSRMAMPEYLLVFKRWPESEAEEILCRPVKHAVEEFPLEQWQRWASPVWGWPEAGDSLSETDVLNTAKAPGDEKHVCPLPMDLTTRVVRLWSNQDEVVLSPFAGIGSEGVVALREGRRFIGVELKTEYFKVACGHMETVDSQGRLFP